MGVDVQGVVTLDEVARVLPPLGGVCKAQPFVTVVAVSIGRYYPLKTRPSKRERLPLKRLCDRLPYRLGNDVATVARNRYAVVCPNVMGEPSSPLRRV